ncbi:methyltransferase domain-containing protein [Streptomyces sp. NPDC046727]|uniref:methyltransferase domain-containing protein n=1 Tax=Streptomyces sp. NPDC046727 TaxID=3155373 RepID=UPI00340ECC4F
MKVTEGGTACCGPQRSRRTRTWTLTEEMLALAFDNAARAGATNVESLKGIIEAIPLPAKTVDVVISNCVINLSVDKPAVSAKTFRVLRPGDRIGVCDVVAEDTITPEQRTECGGCVGCIAGALSFAEYHAGLEAAGFTDIEIAPTHPVADGMHSAIVRAVKPSTDACCGVAACRTEVEPELHAPCGARHTDASA